MNTLSRDSWIAYYKPNHNAKLRLFCFSHAGGSASVFRDWQNHLPNNIQVCPIEMPGRGSRSLETPFTDMTALIKAIALGIKSYLDLPFAFFGHSLGASIGYELAHFVQREYGKSPAHFIVAGRQAPHIPEPFSKHTSPKVELVTELNHMGNTPTEVLENEKLLKEILPTIKADLKLDETYHCQNLEPLNCPITVFGGLEDPETTEEGLEAWSKYTLNSFVVHFFPGNHFFIDTEKQLLLKKIGEIL